MIARTQPTWQPETWQQQLAAAIRTPAELLAALGLRAEQFEGELDADPTFPLRIPHSFLRRMRRGDPADPLLRQVLPLKVERRVEAGYFRDPVGDLAARCGAGVLRKYHGRALLIATGACAVHCRYCFRRHFPYADAQAGANQWRDAVDAIDADPSITEVILSGGDPLALSTARLAPLIEGLAGIPHLRRLRVHSRLPIVLPARVESGLVELLAGNRLKPVMIVHANHPNEIDGEVTEALARIAQAGVVLFNQSVLLRGVNDNAEALIRLSEVLFAAGVIPYYLHLLDPVEGAAHFEVDPGTAQALYRDLQARLPGYLLPRLVREVPGAAAKLPPAV